MPERQLVAVTGATGHLGANLVRALLSEGRDVRAITVEPLDQPLPALRGLPVERFRADVRDAAAVDRALRGVDVVYHLAARISLVSWDAPLVWSVNVGGVANVVEACLNNGVRRLVHVSSLQALSPLPEGAVVDENRPLADDRHLPLYNRSKAAGERVVADGVARGLDAVVINPTGMMGPDDWAPSAQGRVLLDIWRRRLPALISGGFNWVDVRDVARAAVAAELQGGTGRRYILGGTWVSMPQLACLAAEQAGVKPPPLTLPMWMGRAMAPAASAFYRLSGRTPRFTPVSLYTIRHHRHVTHARAADELGHKPRPLAETLADTYAWFRRESPLQQRLVEDDAAAVTGRADARERLHQPL